MFARIGQTAEDSRLFMVRSKPILWIQNPANICRSNPRESNVDAVAYSKHIKALRIAKFCNAAGLSDNSA